MTDKQPEAQRTLKVFIKGDKLHLVSEEVLSISEAQNLQTELSNGIISIFKSRFFESKD
jgi:hypothetical protein